MMQSVCHKCLTYCNHFLPLVVKNDCNSFRGFANLLLVFRFVKSCQTGDFAVCLQYLARALA